MHLEADYKGDEGYIAEDLLSGFSDLELRCKAIDKAVRENYFTLSTALPIYEVTEAQFIAYKLLRSDIMNSTDKQFQLWELLRMMLDTYSSVASSFTGRKRDILNEVKEWVH